MENNKIINISDVMTAFQLFFNVMIKAVQVDIRKKLAGQITDWDAFVSDKRCKQIVACEIGDERSIAPCIDDGSKKPQCFLAFDFA